MDGGGRYLQPMTAYPAGIAVARAASGNRGGASSQFKNPPRIKKLFGASRGVRRRSAGVPIEQRLPRFLGSGLAVGFFSVVIGFGLWQGGHIDGFIRDYGEPHHALARAVGLGLEQVTISGISQMGENEVLAAAGINSKLSLAFLDVNEPARAPRARSDGQVGDRAQALSERARHHAHRARGACHLAEQRRAVRHCRRRHGDRPDAGRALSRPALRGGRGRQHAQQGLPCVDRGRRPAQAPRSRRHARRRPALDAQDGQRHGRAPAGARRPPMRWPGS